MAISPTVRRRRLGSEIRRLRDAERMSGGALAKKIGTSQPQLSRVENARSQACSRHPHPSRRRHQARALLGEMARLLERCRQ